MKNAVILNLQCDDAVRIYLRKIAKYEELTAERELELAGLALKGDKLAKRLLVQANLNLVVKIAKTAIHKSPLPLTDLIQEGNMALINSVDKFKPELGFRFGTYASWWVKQAMFKAISEQSNCVKIPVYIQETLSKYNKVRKNLEQKYGCEVQTSKICQEMNIEESKIELYLNAYMQKISLDEACNFGQENSLSYGEIIEDKRQNIEKIIEDKELKNDINTVIEFLNPREKDVLKKRYGLIDSEKSKITLDEIGKEYGVTKECVRQIEKRAIKKIQQNAEFKEALGAYI